MGVQARPEIWDEVAKSYTEAIAPEVRALARDVQKILAGNKLSAPRSLLEAGCGSGHLSLVLQQSGYETYLLDFSAAALQKARKSYRAALGRIDDAQFISGDLMQLDAALGDQRYDVVWNSGVLEHFSADEVQRVFQQMGSAAREAVLILVPNPESLIYLLWRKRALGEANWAFGTEMLRDNYVELARSAGLSLIARGYCGAEITRIQLAAIMPNEPLRSEFEELIRSGPVPSQALYLSWFLFSPVDQPVAAAPAPPDAAVMDRTFYLDSIGLANAAAVQQRIALDELKSRSAYERQEIEQLRAQLQASAEQSRTLAELLDATTKHAEVAARGAAEQSAARRSADEQFEALRGQLQRAEAQISAVGDLTRELIEDASRRAAETRTMLTAAFEQRTALNRLAIELEAARNAQRDLTAQVEQARAALAEQETHEARLRNTLAFLHPALRESLNAEEEAIRTLEGFKLNRGFRVARLLQLFREEFIKGGRRLAFLKRLAARALGGKQPISAFNALDIPIRPLRHAAHRLREALARIGPDGLAYDLPRHAPDASATEPRRQSVEAGVPGLVSVILPVYNQAYLLRDSIESVLAQTYPHFELIVVNDGSKDDVGQVVAAYAGHPKVRVLTQPNQKLPKALSNGFEFARGEFRTWTSADNLMAPRQLERQVDFLRRNPDAHMVYCDYWAIDDRGAPLNDPNFRPHNRRTPTDPAIHLPHDPAPLNTVHDNFIGACFMYRGWVGRLLGDYVPMLGVEDYDYWMRMNALFVIRHLGTDEPLYHYRVHDNTLSARAVEHRILDRAKELLRFDERRRAYFSKPWLIRADELSRGWLRNLDLGEHALGPWPGQAPPADQKTLLLIHARELAALERHEQRPADAVFAWFDEDPTAPYRGAQTMQRLADGCFAGDPKTLARLELFTTDAWLATPGKALLDAAVARANNACFLRANLTPAELSRTLPRTLRATERPLRVLLQVDQFLQGGLENVVLDKADALAAEGCRVTILSLGAEGPAADKASARRLDFRRLDESNRRETYRELLAREQVDIVSAHYSLFGPDVAAELGIPFVQTIHNSYVWLNEAQRAEHRAIDAQTRAYCCVSSSAAMYADVRIGLSVERMLVVPNGIDTAALLAASGSVDRAGRRRDLNLNETDFAFLNVGSIYPPKCQHLLIAALQIARARDPRIKLICLGRPMDEDYAARVRRQVEQAGLRDAVHWAGYQPDPREYYYICDGFVLPSFVEGSSLALAEARLLGLPIVASRVGDAPDVLGAVNHFLIDPPFRSITDLDAGNWYDMLMQDHPNFVSALAEALLAAAQSARLTPSAQVVRQLDRRCAYETYLRLFEWLRAGGEAAAARPWGWSQRRSE